MSDGPYKCLGTDDFGVRGVRKRLNLSDLSPSCLEEIRHSVLVKRMTHKEAADFHRVKPLLISRLMCSMKKDPEFISKREEKMNAKQETR